MTQPAIDTLRFANRLKNGGFTGEQAEACAEAIGTELNGAVRERNAMFGEVRVLKWAVGLALAVIVGAFAFLYQGQKALVEGVTRIEGRMDRFEEEFSRQGEILDRHTERFNQQDKILARQGAQLDHQSEILARHTELLDRQGELLDQQGKLLIRQGELLDQVSTRLDRQGEQLDQVSTRLDRQGEQLDQRGTRLDRQGEQLDQQGTRLDQRGKRLDGIEELLRTLVANQSRAPAE